MSQCLFTKDEVAQQSTEDDLWIIISGKVYDVTKFVEEHPGMTAWPCGTPIIPCMGIMFNLS